MDNDTGSSSPSSVSYVTPLLISLIGIASSSLAIIIYHLILVNLCLRPDQQQSQESNTSDARQQDELGISQWDMGLDEDILNSIPIFSYSNQKDKLLHVDQSECIICLGGLEHGDNVRLLPTCTHVFHVSCIDKWFAQHSTCPLCRCPLVVPVLNPEYCGISLPPESVHGGQFDVVLDLPADDNELHFQHKDDKSGDSSASCSSSSGVNLSMDRLLKHSVSLKLTGDHQEKAQAEITCLKRSLSMDPCRYYIARVNMQSDREKPCSCSKQELDLQNKTFETAKSTRPFERVSNILVGSSFSQIRNNRLTATASTILPI